MKNFIPLNQNVPLLLSHLDYLFEKVVTAASALIDFNARLAGNKYGSEFIIIPVMIPNILNPPKININAHANDELLNLQAPKSDCEQ